MYILYFIDFKLIAWGFGSHCFVHWIQWKLHMMIILHVINDKWWFEFVFKELYIHGEKSQILWMMYYICTICYFFLHNIIKCVNVPPPAVLIDWWNVQRHKLLLCDHCKMVLWWTHLMLSIFCWPSNVIIIKSTSQRVYLIYCMPVYGQYLIIWHFFTFFIS